MNGLDLYEDDMNESVHERRHRFRKTAVLTVLCWCTLIYNLCSPQTVSSSTGIATIVLNGMRVLIQIQMSMNLHEVKQFIHKLSSELDDRTRRILSIISLAFFMMTFFFFFTSFVIILLRSRSYSKSIARTVIWLTFTLATDILIFSAGLYCLTLILLYIHQKRRITSLYHASKRGRDDVMFNTANEMAQVCTTFDKLFSLHPLTWLSCNFLITIHLLVSGYSGEWENHTFHLFLYLYQPFLTALFIVMILWVKEEINGHRRMIHFTYCLSDRDHREMGASLCYALDEALKSDFTVCGMFAINRNLMFSYVTALLTFSVLAVQLENGTLIPKIS